MKSSIITSSFLGGVGTGFQENCFFLYELLEVEVGTFTGIGKLLSVSCCLRISAKDLVTGGYDLEASKY